MPVDRGPGDGTRRPALQARHGKLSVLLAPGDVVLVARNDSAELAALTVVRVDETPEGPPLLVLRGATVEEFGHR